ncbi:hypothetical protein OG943_45965 [Amycolatopsis sp. NBC_00345]|uniref:hypothetical protein n=1 Tax=Amycolatopsis sp. NBC_00345 TaxID=2975955 RepID=UPI002E260B63
MKNSSISFHSYGGCGWHYSQFAFEPGRALYRWRVNQLLARSDLGLRLADDGEDIGRLVAVTDDARADLVTRLANQPPGRTSDRVRHGIALYRARGSTEHDKRSAILVLAGIIEERRQLLKDNLVKKDEGALFDIANNFALRHQDLKQQRDYDPVFLDWISGGTWQRSNSATTFLHAPPRRNRSPCPTRLKTRPEDIRPNPGHVNIRYCR